MRIRRLEARIFGPLRDRSLDLDASVVLVTGNNESGKSSFRCAVETIFYGFEPAQRELHPLGSTADGEPETLHLEADLAVREGDEMRVERVLQSRATSRLAAAGVDFEGRRGGNLALDCTAELPRAVFQSVYSLELEQLTALGSGVQKHVDDLLLPETRALGLRAISEVRAELRREHRELWRADNRGKPLARQLRDELSRARERALGAEDAERELREARVERADREARVCELGERKRAFEQTARDAPYLRSLFEWQRRRRRLGPPVDLSGLGEFPMVDPAGLTADIAGLEETLSEPEARLAQPEERLGERGSAVLAAASDIEVALESRPRFDRDRLEAAQTRERSDSARRRAMRELESVRTAPPDDDASTRAAGLPLEALRALHLDWFTAWERADAASPRGRNAGALGFATGCAGLALVALTAFGWLDPRAAALDASRWLNSQATALGASRWLDSQATALGALGPVDPRAAALGVLGLLVASVALWLAFRGARKPAPAPARPAQLDEAFADLAIAPALLSSPAQIQRLLEVLGRVREAWDEAAELEIRAGALDDAVRDLEQGWSALCRKLDLDPAGGGEVLAARLREALESARERDRRVHFDAEQRTAAARLRDTYSPRLERTRAHLRALEETLAANVTDSADVHAAYAAACERLRDIEFVRRREAELIEDPRFEILARDPRVLAEEPAPEADWLPEIEARREDEIARLDTALASENRRLGELARLLGDDTGSGLAEAADAVAELEERLDAVARERDRLALAESLLARAETEYRETHQPDVLRRAGAYLRRVTDGRYSRLDYLDGEGGGLHVTSAERAEPVPVTHPLSRGTLDQIFLCLRLGLLDHLDADRERLPLVLDDALVRMDASRRAGVYALLREAAERRQIFVLTCHNGIADEIEATLAARRIDLSP